MRTRQTKSESFHDFSSRLRAAREKLGLTQEQLGKNWGKTGNYIYMMEAGLKPIPKKSWILIQALEAEVSKRLEFLEPSVSPGALPKGTAPVVSWASAGKGGAYCDLAEYLDEFVETDSTDPNKYALIVEGDSMAPEFKPGDRLVIAPNLEAVNGDEVIARLKETGQVLFKVFHQYGDRIILTSYNSSVFPPLEFTKSDFRFIQPVYQMLRRRKGRK